MKKLIFILFAIVAIQLATLAQKATAHKWYTYTIGGKKSYYLKTHQFTNEKMIENQTGSGSQFDNSLVEVPIVAIATNGNDELVVLKYGDSSYYALVFKNITTTSAMVQFSDDAFKTIEEAKSFEPTNEGTEWFTEAGFAKANKKPAMPEMKKQDVIAFIKYFGEKVKLIKEKTDELKTDDDKMKSLGMVMVLATVPAAYAKAKGYHEYKSMAVIERGIKKFKNDKDLKKLVKDIGLEKL
jgi:hypothetical protein